MRNWQMFFGLILSFGFFTSCNPDCENYARVNAEITPKLRLPGEQIMVRTTPSDFLKDRELFIEKIVDGELKIDESTKIESQFVDMPTAKGRVATLPMDVEGNRNIYIKDDDCGGFIPLNSVEVVDQEYIARNQSLFISPATPNIVLPTLPTVPPVNVINTWFSPNNREYCIWIVPQVKLNEEKGCYEELAPLQPGNVRIGPGTNQSGSWELTASCSDPNLPSDALFDKNPVSGILDRESGFVSIAIDRTSKGLGIERYEGTLVDPKSLPKEDRIIGACGPDEAGQEAETMIVLTSQSTGRQLILYRFDVVGLDFHGKQFCN
jgi:hypothetical protein